MADHDVELLSAYIDDELSPQERRALEARLSQDPGLRQALDEMRQTTRLLGGLPRVGAPRNFTLDPAAYRRPARSFDWWGIRLAGALGALASVTLVVGALLIFSAPAAMAPIAAHLTQAPAATSVGATQTAQATEKVTAVVEASAGTADHAAADWENLAEGDYISVTALPTPAPPQMEATATLAAIDEAVIGKTAAAMEMGVERTPIPAAPLPQAAIEEAEAPVAGAPPPGYEELRDMGGGLGGAAPESQLTSPTQAPAATKRESGAVSPTVTATVAATLMAEEAFGMGGGGAQEPSPSPTQTSGANERSLAAALPTVTAPATASPVTTATPVTWRELRGREAAPTQGADVGPALIIVGLALLALSAGLFIVALWQRRR